MSEVSTRLVGSKSGLDHFGDPSSADLAPRNACRQGRNRRRSGAVRAGRLGRANEPGRVVLASIGGVDHLVFNPLLWRHGRVDSAADRVGNVRPPDHRDRPSPPTWKGSPMCLAPLGAVPRYGSSHPLLSDEVHSGLRRQFIANGFPRRLDPIGRLLLKGACPAGTREESRSGQDQRCTVDMSG